MSALVIDAFEFCRLKERLEGEVAVAGLKRLATDCVNPTTSVRWSLQGGADTLGHPQMMISAVGTVQLMCQRCMTPFEFPFSTESVLLLASNDDEADRIEEVVADDSIDVIVGSRTMKVLELVEDEALLALPLSPKHEVCPDVSVLDALKPEGKPSPFAVLKNIKREN